jgi:hypothetical protein
MVHRRLATLAAALTMSSAVAHAQPAGPLPPVAPAAAEPAAPVTAAPPATAVPAPAPAPERADYDDAFRAMIAGDLARAIALFDGVAARSADPELASAARELARLARELVTRKIVLRGPGGATGPTAAGATEDDHDDGRASFVVTSTLYGAYAGVVLIDDANISDTRAAILAITGTTAVGLLGSIYGSRGHTMTGSMGDAYTLGMIEGFANAGLLVSPLGATGSSEEVQTTLLLSGAVGGVAGLAYAYNLRPTRGQVSFAGTLSILGIASTGLGSVTIKPSGNNLDLFLSLMAGGLDAGLAAGLVLGRDLDWSTSRGRLVQLGSLVGGLSGLAVGALITGGRASDDNDIRLLTGLGLAGLWGGFAIAVRSTRGMRPDGRFARPAVTTQVTPLLVRGGAGLAFTGQF